MKTACLYTGQGSQVTGMGASLYEAFESFAASIDQADSLVDFDLKKLMFEGPEEELSKTQYTQPALAAFAAGVTNVLRTHIKPDYVAGLSLGEYSALYAAGVFDEKTLIETTAFRGKQMALTTEGIPAKMIAVMGLSPQEADQVANEAAKKSGSGVWATNYNATGQVVLSGYADGIACAKTIAKEAGAKRVMDLKVSSAFHTPLMEEASAALRSYFETVSFGAMQIPVLFNVIGDVKTEVDTIPDLLEKQIKSPVRMMQTLQRLEALGVERIIEIGPGRTMAGFVKRTTGIKNIVSIETAEDLKALVEA